MLLSAPQGRGSFSEIKLAKSDESEDEPRKGSLLAGSASLLSKLKLPKKQSTSKTDDLDKTAATPAAAGSK